VFGHWLLGAYFTATSFIGMIALAGVMVRNSVLLIDFIEIRLNDGEPLKQAIIEGSSKNLSYSFDDWSSSWSFHNLI
jgi:multidrug efflux pump subunit AcrB